MDKQKLITLFKKKINHGDIDAVKVFKIIHYKHGGVAEKDFSPQLMRKLLKFTLQRELPIDKSPRTLLAVLHTMHKRTHSKMQVDCLIRKGGLFGQSTETVPYVIAKSSVDMTRKIAWLNGLVNDDEIGHLFDLNRRVGRGGNLFINSFTQLHIDDIQWYTFLLDKLHLAVNSKQNGKTLIDFLVKELNELKSSKQKLCHALLELLEQHGGKTQHELRQ